MNYAISRNSHLFLLSCRSTSPTMISSSSSGTQYNQAMINYSTHRYPFCIVWTPIPVLSWFFPFIGHMGIAMSNGVIRDFAGPYHVSEDDMGFGWPTRYLQLNPMLVSGGSHEWDEAVSKSSVLYGTRMQNFCDNCHSHVGLALQYMKYRNRTNYNMIYLAAWLFISGKYVGFGGFLKTWLPFFVVVTVCTIVGMYL